MGEFRREERQKRNVIIIISKIENKTELIYKSITCFLIKFKMYHCLKFLL